MATRVVGKKALTLSRPVADGIYCITLPLLGGKPGPVNVYLFVGRHNITLLDTGISGTFSRLKRALSEHGLTCDDIDQIVVTHSHLDHFGAVKKILRASRSHIVVAGNFEKTVSLATGLGVSRKTVAAFLKLMGVPPIVRGTMNLLSAFFSLLGETCRVTLFLKQDDWVQMGDCACRVIETPGHSIDSICLFYESKRLLFSGDHILPHITPNALVILEEGSAWPVRRSQQEFYESVEKVKSLAPKTVYPAHGRPITDIDQTVELYVNSFREREEKILSVIASGETTIYRISRKMFPQLKRTRLPLELFLAVSEVYTHIQMLAHKGIVHTKPEAGVLVVRIMR
jgi:glyoxylase-like metal-dependent hydrolase (beta-lactamase superfamily II)